jgi:hypothetical protein
MVKKLIQCRRNRSGRPGVRQTNIQLTLSDLQVSCHKKVINLTHAHLIDGSKSMGFNTHVQR